MKLSNNNISKKLISQMTEIQLEELLGSIKIDKKNVNIKDNNVDNKSKKESVASTYAHDLVKQLKDEKESRIKLENEIKELKELLGKLLVSPENNLKTSFKNAI